LRSSTTSSKRRAPNFIEDGAAVDGFLLALRASGRAEKTLETYEYSIELLRRFCAERGMPPLVALSAEHLREFFHELYKRGNKPAGISVRYRALQQFYKWLVAEGERADNPMDRIPPPRVPEVIQPHYSDEELRRVLATIPTTSRDPLVLRNRAVLLTLYDTGIRGGELCALRTDDLNLRGLSLKVRGKGGKERIVGIGPVTAQAIERYLRRRSPSNWLFAARGGGPLSFNALRNMLRRMFAEAGVAFRGVHAFRRAFAISFLADGGQPEDLRTLAGWESPQMLRRYTRATETERAINAHRRHSPVDRLYGRR
jgi:site-specific recombinase XerD